MPQFQRPGVYTTESLTQAQPTTNVTSPSVAGFAGEHWRGPTGAILCNSWSDFVNYYGGFNTASTPVLGNSYLAYSVYEFFANGGQSAYIARVTASATPGASAAVSFLDSSATPQNTLTLTVGRLGVSGNVGTWGNSMYATIANRGGAGSGRFDLILYYGGTTAGFIVETWIDLSMNKTDSRYAIGVLNSPTSGSNWVFATDLNDPAAAPNNCPAVVSVPKVFAGGVDTGVPTTSDWTTFLTSGTCPFDSVPGVLNINLPGQTTTSIINAAITYAQTRPYTFLVMDPPSGQTPAAVVSYFQGLSPVSSYAALYYPWLTASNPASTSLNSTILLPPGGFILGQMTSIDTAQGPWVAPAGINTRLGVVAAERLFSPTDLNTLNSNNVNAIRTRGNGNVVIWGARTMQTGYASLYVPVRRSLNYIENALSELLQFAVFQPNTSTLWGTIGSICNQFLGGLFARGAFAGNTQASSYFVTCDSTINTPQTIASGVLNVQVGVALVYPAEFINILISQFQGQTTVTTTA